MKVPLHPKANHYLRSGLFSEVQSFEDIENRIENLATAKERGDAFEVFVEACLATQRIHQAKEVWPENTMPRETRERLRLPSTDKGVDGIYLTTDKTVCYQVKFRSGRKHITFTDLSTFYSLADGGDQKLVFTNSDKIGGTATDRIGAIFVRGTDLERLNRDDFKEIETWLQGAKIETRKKEPLPHQEEALSDILSGLSKQSRTTALMACASGKTLVALWTAEKLDAKTILVLLPSLALVRQTLYEWMHETSISDVDYRCVCSDETVKLEEDSLIVRPSELGTPQVTTSHSELRQFLEQPTSATKIVFSTYQSSQVVSEASIGLPPFDFGVFDEAHKTAGRVNKKNGLALSDENIAIKRRLFLTATPKHYEVGKKDRHGDSKTVFSMDDQVIYGSVCHQLTFRDAAKAGIITDYKVIISIVTSEMVTNEAIRRGIVNIKGDEVKARQVAHQIALISAIRKYNASKVFTFHTKVSAAKSFTSKESAGIATHIEGFNTTHVEGKMPTSAREQIMKEFAKHPKAILSNARCLTEGVDVPAVDMVAFMSPKRSLVDIVQATGRALRTSDETNKKVGYVLVPIYVEQERGESIKEAVLRSNFDEVWRVLQAMKEQDELLAQSVKEMQVERGKTGGFDDQNSVNELVSCECASKLVSL
jgi:predicted helicase